MVREPCQLKRPGPGWRWSKWELIQRSEGDRRYVRQDEDGQFTDGRVSVGRSLAHDQRPQAETKATPAHGGWRDRWTPAAAQA